jgi:hypothetical protein
VLVGEAKEVTGRGARQKGATFEREIANRLKAIYPAGKRGIAQARSSTEVADVDGDGVP